MMVRRVRFTCYHISTLMVWIFGDAASWRLLGNVTDVGDDYVAALLMKHAFLPQPLC